MNRKDSVSSSIMHLFKHGSPSAVGGIIISIIIHSLNRHIVWPISHVFKKIRKAQPPFTNTNAPSSVVSEMPAGRVHASLNHGRPCSICGRELPATVSTDRRMSVLCELFGHKEVMPATAGRSVSASNGSRSNLNYLSAIAFTETPSFQITARGSCRRNVLYNFEASKCSSDDAYFCRHNVMALCLAAAFGYWPNVCRDSFLTPTDHGVNV